jgi:hypothetical protein
MPNLKPFEQIAFSFANALIQGDNDGAYELLVPELKETLSPEQLNERFMGMWQSYSDGQAEYAVVEQDSSMQDWPDKQSNDSGWCYVGIIGSNFAEAVIVVVAERDGELFIRDVQWGRP